MTITRRKLLEMCSLVAASAAMPLQVLAKLAGAPLGKVSSGKKNNDYDALWHMTAATFKPWIGSTFTIHLQGSKTALALLTDVTDLSTNPNKPWFSLRFQGYPGTPLTQNTYVFENSVLGRFALLVVPTGGGSQPTFYTGLVNRSSP
jgi:hypothetical protein